MEPIKEGATGAAVEDIQERLGSLGYTIDATERDEKTFGRSTATAVARFRLDHGLTLGDAVDAATWSALVDESYQLGDRTLYLRLPNFHGRDVRQLQERLNILGFSCGEVDGFYGAHTEAAVKLFQESVGTLADGMAFPDTFDAIERLKHVWGGKPANGPHPTGDMGFARAANVLETFRISVTADDPISRNVAGIDSVDAAGADTQAVILLSSAEHPLEEAPSMGAVVLDDTDTLPRRLRTALQGAREVPPVVRIDLPVGKDAGDGTFTISDAQTFAVLLLDAICAAFDGLTL